VVIEQVVRPTGLLILIDIRPSVNQIGSLLDEIDKRIRKVTDFSATSLRGWPKVNRYTTDKYQIKMILVMHLWTGWKSQQLRLSEIDVLVDEFVERHDLPEVSQPSRCG
jgi:excinuclease UvrABC helicase subunit UvrB